MYDVLIKGGRVIDGTGSPWRKADVGVSGDSIAKIGMISESDAERVIDARGLVVSPGWIDIHLHADHTVLGDPACLSFAHQGITTVTMGNCGLSMYPLTPDHKEDLIEYLLPFTSGLRINWDWSTMDEFLARLDAFSLNMVPFIGHGSIRTAVMGLQDRGLLLEGMKADITVFDPEKVKDLSTFENPHVYPEGISAVIVNGAITVDNGEHTGALNGKILKKL